MPREDYYRKRARNHADIRRLLKQMNSPQINVDALADALNALNAAGMLAEVQRKFPTAYLCYGPKTVRDECSEPYIGSVIWCRPAGYYHYETVTVCGIWAVQMEQTLQIIVGTRTLEFILPFYQPEQYQYEIRKDFMKYYGSDVPPAAEPLHAFDYEPDSRIDQRLILSTLLDRWLAGYQEATSTK